MKVNKINHDSSIVSYFWAISKFFSIATQKTVQNISTVLTKLQPNKLLNVPA
jgi:hypothetical protein